jgi:hypothetical protein
VSIRPSRAMMSPATLRAASPLESSAGTAAKLGCGKSLACVHEDSPRTILLGRESVCGLSQAGLGVYNFEQSSTGSS